MCKREAFFKYVNASVDSGVDYVKSIQSGCTKCIEAPLGVLSSIAAVGIDGLSQCFLALTSTDKKAD